MTEAAQETTPKRKRKPKSTSLPVMKQLVDLMEQRTAIMATRRKLQGELANCQVQLGELEREIQWRANIFGMTEAGQASSPAPTPISGFPSGPFDPSALTQPIFHTPPPQRAGDGVNRGMADLRSLS